ncbi:MAG: hypothetical protein N3G22_01215 [Candidatus Micrarchaeota archaeon]|nr:hypothetical protein [Candidatus Micrarchaeota archaeon]
MPAKKVAKGVVQVNVPKKDLSDFTAIEIWLLIIIGAFGVMNFVTPLPQSVQFISATLILIIGITKLIGYEAR